MTLHLVASNPDAPPSSKAEQAVRKLTFAEAELRQAAAHHPQRAEIYARIRAEIGVAMQILRGLMGEL